MVPPNDNCFMRHDVVAKKGRMHPRRMRKWMCIIIWQFSNGKDQIWRNKSGNGNYRNPNCLETGCAHGRTKRENYCLFVVASFTNIEMPVPNSASASVYNDVDLINSCNQGDNNPTRRRLKSVQLVGCFNIDGTRCMAKETSSSSVLETKFMYKLRSTKLLLRNPPFQVIITIIIISLG